MFLDSSRDILNLGITFAVVLIAIFICWAMYYLIVMLKNVSKMTISIREKLELVDNILKLVKDKLEKGSSHVALISDSLIKMVGFLIEKHRSGVSEEKQTFRKKKK